MAGEVALRLLLKGQKEVAAGLDDITKQTGDLGKVAGQAAVGTKALSDGLSSVQKQGLQATASSKAYLKATQDVADAQQAAAAAATKAAKARLAAADALADATAKQAAGDREGADAAKASADALDAQARSAQKSATALRATASAARSQASALKASASAADLASKSGAGGASRLGMLAKAGGVLTKTGLAVGGYMGYEGVKRAASLQGSMTQLQTLANVPSSQISGLTKWTVSNSPGLRETSGVLASQMYRIASSAPGHPYSAKTLEQYTRAAAMLSVVGGSNADPEQTARIFGIIRANGGLGTKNAMQMGSIIAAGVGTGDMTMSDAVAALGTGGLATNAARHKISLQQVMGVLAQEGDLGVNGSRAGTSMQHAISLIASPNKQAAALYNSIGLGTTQLDQVMRTQGLTAAMAVLKSHLAAAIPAGGSTTAAQFMAQGATRKQATAMVGQGSASAEDLYLTQMFGGAKQSVPIIALLDGLTRTNAKIGGAGATTGANSLQSKFNIASATPAERWTQYTLDMQQFESNIGLRLIPKLESMASWFSRNEGAVKDFSVGLGVLAIPAIAAYGAKLAMNGVTNVSNFTKALRGSNSELSAVGSTAAGQSRGLGVLGSSVMGVTTAIGVFGLGRATASHGAGGAVTAGLGGAVAGMVTGFAIGGPFGAAVGGAVGALAGLAGHFLGVSHSANTAMTASQQFAQSLKTSYQSDKYRLGAESNQSILSYLSTPGETNRANALSAAGVRISGIDQFLLSGGNQSVGAGATVQAAYQAGVITKAQEALGLAALTDIESTFGSTVSSLSTIAELSGQTSQYAQNQTNTLQTLLNSMLPGGSTGVTSNKSLADLLTDGMHVHVHIDGKDVTGTVENHQRDRDARK